MIDQALASRTVSIYDISGSSPVFAGTFGLSVFSEPNLGAYRDDRYEEKREVEASNISHINRFNNLVGVVRIHKATFMLR